VPDYRLRPARAADEPFLYACYTQTMRDYVALTWGWDEEFQHAAFREHLPWHGFEIITVDSVPVGGACVLDRPSALELEMIIIDRRFQRRGIGTAYVAALLRRARRERRRVALRVLKVNPAQALYERLGFVPTGEDDGVISMQAEP